MSRPSSLASDRPVLLVQLSDSHLFAEEDGKLLGMDTCDSLAKVIERVQAEQPQIDLILASGDLSQDGSAGLLPALSPTSARQLERADALVPRQSRRAASHAAGLRRQRSAANRSSDLGHWRIILLDSSIPGAVPGLSGRRPAAAAGAGPERSAANATIWCASTITRCPSAAPGWSRSACATRTPCSPCWSAIRRLRALLWGHVHQEFDQHARWHAPAGLALDLRAVRSGQRGVPGGQRGARLSLAAPACRTVELETGVSRVTGIDFEVDYSVKGYELRTRRMPMLAAGAA